MGRYIGVNIVACLMSIGASVAQAQDDTTAAMEFLKTKHAHVEKILKTSKGKQKDAKNNAELKEALNELLDYDELAKQSLGSHWNERKPKEQKEFTELLKQLVQRNYEQNLTDTLDYTIRYLNSRKEENGVIVSATAKSKAKNRAPAITLEYTMHSVGNGWKIYDVTTDGVSMVRNYRNQFGRIVLKHGWNELIHRMKNRLDNKAEI